MTTKFSEGQKVKFRNIHSEYRDQIYSVFGYANPGIDEYIYLIDSKKRIITVLESQLEPVLEKMKYKGYTTTPEYSQGTDSYYGHIENIKFYVPWESSTFESCRKEFESQVDSYLDFLEGTEISEEDARE